MTEEYWSRIYCVPSTVVEAVSGAAETELLADEITHHSPRPKDGDKSRNDSIMSHLLTRWELRPYPYKPPPTGEVNKDSKHEDQVSTEDRCDVSLRIEYKFSNPMYGALSQAAAPKVADKMIEAFEARVRSVVDGQAK